MSCGGIFDLEGKQRRLSIVEQLLAKPDVWSDQKRAQELGREKKGLDSTVSALLGLTSGLEDAKELFEIARPQSDDATLTGLISDVAKYEKEVAALEFRRMFSNPLHPNNCFLDIQ